MQIAICKMQSANCNLQIPICNLIICTLHFKICNSQSSICKLQYANSNLKTSICHQISADYSLEKSVGILCLQYAVLKFGFSTIAKFYHQIAVCRLHFIYSSLKIFSDCILKIAI